MNSAVSATAGARPPPASGSREAMNPRTRLLLEGRIVPTLLLLAWPNVLVMLAQGAGRLFWPLLGGFSRLIIAIGGGWLVLRFSGSLNGLFAALTLALVVYGVSPLMAIRSGAWFSRH